VLHQREGSRPFDGPLVSLILKSKLAKLEMLKLKARSRCGTQTEAAAVLFIIH
jgi:hypothetical protein